jgi:hypothetical protein
VLAVAVALFVVAPLGVVAATPRLHDSGRLGVRYPDTLLPVSASISPWAVTREDTVKLSWRSSGTASTQVFYRVLRREGNGAAFCARRRGNAADSCDLSYMEPVTTTDVTAFTDHPGRGTWSYRIGVAANWVNDPRLGDVYVVSAPVTVTVR